MYNSISTLLIHLHTVKWFQVLICITNNSIKHQSFVYTVKWSVLFQTIQFSISHLFALSLNVKQFILNHRKGPIRCYHFGPEWTWEQWRWRGILHCPNLQYYQSLNIRLFNVISKKFIEKGLTPLQRCNEGVFCIAWISSISRASTSDYLMSYPGNL